MRRTVPFLLLIFSTVLAAQSVHLTVPAVDASNHAVTIGTAYFTWGQFVDNNGATVQAGQLTRLIANGTIDVTLTASDNAGYVYTVLLMNGSMANTFKWRVPAAGATTMAQLNQPATQTGSNGNATAIQGNAVLAGTPTAANQAYLWNPANSDFELTTLGSAALQPSSAFDAAGAATAALASAAPKWVLAYSSVQQTVPSGFASYTLLFDVNDPNTNDSSMHSTTSNKDRLVAPVDGYYAGACLVASSTSSTNSTYINVGMVHASTTTSIGFAGDGSTQTNGFGFNAPFSYYLHAGDYVFCRVNSGSGFITNSGQSNTQFYMYSLR